MSVQENEAIAGWHFRMSSESNQRRARSRPHAGPGQISQSGTIEGLDDRNGRWSVMLTIGIITVGNEEGGHGTAPALGLLHFKASVKTCRN